MKSLNINVSTKLKTAKSFETMCEVQRLFSNKQIDLISLLKLYTVTNMMVGNIIQIYKPKSSHWAAFINFIQLINFQFVIRPKAFGLRTLLAK